MPIVAISGGFSVLHKGHTRLIEAAAEYGSVVVILNSDEWIERKYGYRVVDWASRAEVMMALKYVHNVILAYDSDGTVCETLKHLKPNYFANGGDRKKDNTPEVELCKSMGIKTLWNVGGGKVASSSEILDAAS